MVEKCNCISFSVNSHAHMQDINYLGAFCDLNPSEGNSLHDWHDVYYLRCRLRIFQFQF